MKNCKICNLEQDLSSFSSSKDKNGKIYFSNVCKQCSKKKRDEKKTETSLYNKQYYLLNKTKINAQTADYYGNNREQVRKTQAEYTKNNRDTLNVYAKSYRINNKEKINVKYKQKRYEDPNLRIRTSVSSSINKALKQANSSKNNNSILEFLGYSMIQLREHLESQFEPWMTWDNYGKYNADIWKDDDNSTWTWQIDHIIPHSIFKYSSMTDENFKKCWALDNLRPYSAKQNIIDGPSRTRHKKAA